MNMLPTVTRATDFVVLRGIVTSARQSVSLAREPIMVCTLLNEQLFEQTHELVQLRTVLIEDRMHDWDWCDGRFRFYARMDETVDVLVVYAKEEVEVAMKFDPMTGAAL